MGKILSLACALCLLLCACSVHPPSGSDQEEPSPSSEPTQGSEAPSLQPTETALPPDLSDTEALAMAYLYPIAYSNATQTDWSDPTDLEPWQFAAMYAFAEVWSADIPESEYVYEEGRPCYYENQDVVEGYIRQYFDIAPEYLRQSDWYRSEHNAYSFAMDGGVGFVYNPQVLQAEYDGATHQLTLHLDDGFDGSGMVAAVFTVRLEENGRFTCLSNRLL
ncbi:MAG: DUF6070 family protein [Oscillospiraceae bacterium]|jgi:hypothetical protein